MLIAWASEVSDCPKGKVGSGWRWDVGPAIKEEGIKGSDGEQSISQTYIYLASLSLPTIA